MDFILNEAEEEDFSLQFSDEELEDNEGMLNFIDNSQINEESISFYRQRESQKVEDYPKYEGQVRDPIEAIYSDDELYYGEDNQLDLYCPEEREYIQFDKFEGFEKKRQKKLNRVFLDLTIEMIFFPL